MSRNTFPFASSEVEKPRRAQASAALYACLDFGPRPKFILSAADSGVEGPDTNGAHE